MHLSMRVKILFRDLRKTWFLDISAFSVQRSGILSVPSTYMYFQPCTTTPEEISLSQNAFEWPFFADVEGTQF